ncbi:MAG: energy transducer TonB [Flavobacteriales bacterium]
MSETTLRINQERAQEFLLALNKKPVRRTALIFQAIIVSLIAHIFILFVTQMLTEEFEPYKPEMSYEELEVDMPIDPNDSWQERMTQRNSQEGPLRNVVASTDSRFSEEVRNFTGEEAMREQVYQDLKAFEQQEFDNLRDPNSSFETPGKGDPGQQTGGHKSDNPTQQNQHNESYKGNVSARCDMKDRSILSQPLPTYRCKSSGSVVISITIDEVGKVKDASILSGSSDECLRNESLSYVRRWKFSYKEKQKSQTGTIEFTFSAQ